MKTTPRPLRCAALWRPARNTGAPRTDRPANGASLAQFSLALCLQNPQVSTVMPGATLTEQVKENMKAIEFANSFMPDVMAGFDRVFA